MIITRTPLRITLGGGGTDLPSFYRRHGFGLLVAAAIDRYTYISVNENFDDSILLKYSEIERASNLDEIRHPLLREALRVCQLHSRIEISSMADVPSGTGLGSSGSFLVGLLNALYLYRHHRLAPAELAKTACRIEIEVLGEPVGKQDQYVAAFGGLQLYRFNDDESVAVTPINIPAASLRDLEENLLMFYTGIRRSASEILRSEGASSGYTDEAFEDNLLKTRTFALKTVEALESGDTSAFGQILTAQWLQKYSRQRTPLNSQIDALINAGCANGASGGKLIGAGGGGFLLFLATDRSALRAEMSRQGLPEVPIRFDFEGSSILVSR